MFHLSVIRVYISYKQIVPQLETQYFSVYLRSYDMLYVESFYVVHHVSVLEIINIIYRFYIELGRTKILHDSPSSIQ